MATQDVVILVPGLFGFDAFGDGADRIAYFDQVAARIKSYASYKDDQIVVVKPAPTGALEWRVKTLFERVETILRDGLPGVGSVKKVHFIGHSTGGVDIRLLLNPAYSWPGVRDDRRTHFFDRVGGVVSLSAPHLGTPIARRLRGTLESAIPELFLLSILGKTGKFESRRKFALMLELVLQVFGRESSKSMLESVAAIAPATADQISHFLRDIVDDHALIHDLTPFAMARLNGSIAGQDWESIRYYVTAAPAPCLRGSLAAQRGVARLQWLIYTIAYWATHPNAYEGAPFPHGPWIGEENHAEDLTTVWANDGVVPCAAQTMGGPAAGIIEGDHLDVVGHFESKQFRGVTAFKSGAKFDDARFDTLWKTIAADVS